MRLTFTDTEFESLMDFLLKVSSVAEDKALRESAFNIKMLLHNKCKEAETGAAAYKRVLKKERDALKKDPNTIKKIANREAQKARENKRLAMLRVNKLRTDKKLELLKKSFNALLYPGNTSKKREKKITITELCEKTGISRPTITKYIKEESIPELSAYFRK